MTIPFTKLVGTGNDFVLVDEVRHRLEGLASQWPAVARMLCARTAEDVDGLLIVEPSRRADVRMRVFNPDGSEPSMCGNGIRCLAWYAYRRGLVKGQRFSIETKAGVREAERRGADRVRIHMGTPRWLRCLAWPRLGEDRNVHADLIDSGVPHLVCQVKHVARINVDELGRRLRRHRRLAPQGANVDFVQHGPSRARYDAARRQVVYRTTITMRTYERGVEGETQACGTGAVAAAAALIHARMPLGTPLGRESDLERHEVRVRVPGGVLRVSLSGKRQFDTDRLLFSEADLEGEVRRLSQGTFEWNGRRSA